TLTNGVFLLNGLGGANNPAYSIIGAPGGTTYSAAGGSVAGNGPHNPFLNQTATWTFSIPNLVSGVTPGHIVFSFNTSAGNLFSCDSDVAGCEGGGGSHATPEPLSFVLVGSGLIGLYFVRRRR